ncbi:Fic/DOC family protein [Helicobacter japonicus]|uniref:Fic/DOC family protein n=1 Tax=Helicobacter japonicus TaxID=425400 RepID=UPI0023F29DA6|nr:Fic family protein [Helicobacter japonicus]
MQLRNNNDFDSLIVHNKLGLLGEALELKMRELTQFRILELKSNTRFWNFDNFDYAQYKHIHLYVFQDIFEWAGQDRYELGFSGKFSKYIIQFCRGDEISSYADSIFSTLEFKNLNTKDSSQTHIESMQSQRDYTYQKMIAKKLASLWARLNFLHPFREGNGRVSRLFLEMFAQTLHIKFDIENIERRKQVIALNRSMRGNLQSLEELVFMNLEI